MRWPTVPIVYAETRPLAEEWTYRHLAAPYAWALTEQDLGVDLPGPTLDLARRRPLRADRRTDLAAHGAGPAGPPVAEVRAWAHDSGLVVADRGRLRPEVWQAWYAAHPVDESPTTGR